MDIYNNINKYNYFGECRIFDDFAIWRRHYQVSIVTYKFISSIYYFK